MANEPAGRRDARDFTTVPVSALGDTRLTALDLRCIMVIALHDGMSLKKGKGAGCYATAATLSAKIGTDVTNFSKAVSRLCKFGYVLKERQQNDGRRSTLRIIYAASEEKVGALTNYRNDEKLGEFTNDQTQEVGELANNSTEIVGEANLKTHGNLPKTNTQYISLNEEIDFDESSEIDSAEAARIADCDTRTDDVSFSVNEFVSGIFDREKDSAEAQLGSEGQASIKALLPNSWFDLPTEAQLSHFEQAFGKLDREATAIRSKEREEWESWLYSVFDNFAGEPTGHRAERLLGEIAA